MAPAMTKTPVDVIEEIDRNAFFETKAFVKPELLITTIYQLHDLLAVYYSRIVNQLTSDQREALTECLQAMRKEFVFGCLTHLRAHTTDGENYRRKAVEFCAFGIVMLRSSRDATIWLEALKSKNKYSSYKNRFKPMVILKEASDTGYKLALLYEQLCKEVHASPYAIKTQSRIYLQEGKRLNYLNYHDDWTAEGQLALAKSFITAMNLDFSLVANFGRAISMQFPEVDMHDWYSKIEEALQILKDEGERIGNLKAT